MENCVIKDNPHTLPELDPVFSFEINVEIGNGKLNVNYVNEKPEQLREALTYCSKFNIANNIAETNEE
jgi:hypothetical protein